MSCRAGSAAGASDIFAVFSAGKTGAGKLGTVLPSAGREARAQEWAATEAEARGTAARGKNTDREARQRYVSRIILMALD